MPEERIPAAMEPTPTETFNGLMPGDPEQDVDQTPVTLADEEDDDELD